MATWPVCTTERRWGPSSSSTWPDCPRFRPSSSGKETWTRRWTWLLQCFNFHLCTGGHELSGSHHISDYSIRNTLLLPGPVRSPLATGGRFQLCCWPTSVTSGVTVCAPSCPNWRTSPESTASSAGTKPPPRYEVTVLFFLCQQQTHNIYRCSCLVALSLSYTEEVANSHFKIKAQNCPWTSGKSLATQSSHFHIFKGFSVIIIKSSKSKQPPLAHDSEKLQEFADKELIVKLLFYLAD